jgi:hypothetical protein
MASTMFPPTPLAALVARAFVAGFPTEQFQAQQRH